MWNIKLTSILYILKRRFKRSYLSMHLICFSHITRTAGFLPPADVWKAGKDVLPYGWERAVDDTGRSYFIK